MRPGWTRFLGEKRGAVGTLEANWLESAVFLNRGDHFEARALPLEAQFAPAFGVCVGDYDGDGREDIFLSQNFFAVRPEDARYDAGRGLWLQGDGKGGFRAVPGQESGVKVYGEQRGAALGDYDADGRGGPGGDAERGGDEVVPQCGRACGFAGAAPRGAGECGREWGRRCG